MMMMMNGILLAEFGDLSTELLPTVHPAIAYISAACRSINKFMQGWCQILQTWSRILLLHHPTSTDRIFCRFKVSSQPKTSLLELHVYLYCINRYMGCIHDLQGECFGEVPGCHGLLQTVGWIHWRRGCRALHDLQEAWSLRWKCRKRWGTTFTR